MKFETDESNAFEMTKSSFNISSDKSDSSFSAT